MVTAAAASGENGRAAMTRAFDQSRRTGYRRRFSSVATTSPLPLISSIAAIAANKNGLDAGDSTLVPVDGAPGAAPICARTSPPGFAVEWKFT